MPDKETVVAKRNRLTKAELHAELMVGWSRAARTSGGQKAFAEKLDITPAGLSKQLQGAFPTFELIDRAYDIDPTVLNDWLSTKGARIVEMQAICDVDNASVLLARLLSKLVEAQHPDSPGGRKIVPTEIFGETEELLRELIRVGSSLIEQADAYRSGAKLRSVGA